VGFPRGFCSLVFMVGPGAAADRRTGSRSRPGSCFPADSPPFFGSGFAARLSGRGSLRRSLTIQGAGALAPVPVDHGELPV